LAGGYVISDNAIQRAITLDNKHGVSSRFTNALANFDNKYKATDKAKSVDASYGITEKSSRLARPELLLREALGTPPVNVSMTSTLKAISKSVMFIQRLAVWPT
jgi:phosphotransferase system HPr-like phosphotransfer protein